MLLINCPWCGARDQTEFSYHGEAHIVRPENPAGMDDAAWGDYVFFRQNPRGAHRERWMHASGCRRFFVMARDTVSGEIYAVYKPGESPPPLPSPPDAAPAAAGDNQKKTAPPPAAQSAPLDKRDLPAQKNPPSPSSPTTGGEAIAPSATPSSDVGLRDAPGGEAAARMGEDELLRLLDSVGKGCFVRFFELFARAARDEIGNREAAEELRRATGDAFATCKSRVSKAKKIINTAAPRALAAVAASHKTPQSDRALAAELLAKISKFPPQ